MAVEAHDESSETRRAVDDSVKIWNGAVTAFLAVALGVFAIMYGLIFPYDYWVGTPAKASVDHCDIHVSGPKWDRESSPDMTCTGTWHVHGQQQSGPIEPRFREMDLSTVRAGKSTLDVRVRDGIAYTSRSIGKEFYIGLTAGIGILGWGSYRLWRVWTRRRRPTTT
jgi:hypothetical protein